MFIFPIRYLVHIIHWYHKCIQRKEILLICSSIHFIAHGGTFVWLQKCTLNYCTFFAISNIITLHPYPDLQSCEATQQIHSLLYKNTRLQLRSRNSLVYRAIYIWTKGHLVSGRNSKLLLFSIYCILKFILVEQMYNSDIMNSV